jgi:hypothetical protein
VAARLVRQAVVLRPARLAGRGALLGNILLASIGPALPDHAEPGSPGRFARARRGSESVVRPGGFGTW